jgi:hypothetical protein
MPAQLSFSRLCAFVGLFILSFACSGYPSSPGETAKRFTENFASGDIEGAIDMIAAMDQAKPEEKEKLTAFLKKAHTDIEERHQGVKSVEILEEEITDQGNRATVRLKINYNDGKSDEDTYRLVKVEGRWKVIMSK